MTAEFAVLLPVVTLMIAVVLVVVGCAGAQLRCADAARAGARSAALGDPDSVVATVAQQVGGGAVRIAVHRDGDWVRVEVQQQLGPDLPVLGAITVRGEATGRAEP